MAASLSSYMAARWGTTGLFRLIENHLGKAFVKVQQAMQSKCL